MSIAEGEGFMKKNLIICLTIVFVALLLIPSVGNSQTMRKIELKGQTTSPLKTPCPPLYMKIEYPGDLKGAYGCRLNPKYKNSIQCPPEWTLLNMPQPGYYECRQEEYDRDKWEDLDDETYNTLLDEMKCGDYFFPSFPVSEGPLPAPNSEIFFSCKVKYPADYCLSGFKPGDIAGADDDQIFTCLPK